MPSLTFKARFYVVYAGEKGKRKERKKELLDVFCFDFLKNSKTVKQITFFGCSPVLGHRLIVFNGVQISSSHTKVIGSIYRLDL